MCINVLQLKRNRCDTVGCNAFRCNAFGCNAFGCNVSRTRVMNISAVVAMTIAILRCSVRRYRRAQCMRFKRFIEVPWRIYAPFIQSSSIADGRLHNTCRKFDCLVTSRKAPERIFCSQPQALAFLRMSIYLSLSF